MSYVFSAPRFRLRFIHVFVVVRLHIPLLHSFISEFVLSASLLNEFSGRGLGRRRCSQICVKSSRPRLYTEIAGKWRLQNIQKKDKRRCSWTSEAPKWLLGRVPGTTSCKGTPLPRQEAWGAYKKSKNTHMLEKSKACLHLYCFLYLLKSAWSKKELFRTTQPGGNRPASSQPTGSQPARSPGRYAWPSFAWGWGWGESGRGVVPPLEYYPVRS